MVSYPNLPKLKGMKKMLLVVRVRLTGRKQLAPPRSGQATRGNAQDARDLGREQREEVGRADEVFFLIQKGGWLQHKRQPVGVQWRPRPFRGAENFPNPS